MIEIKSRYDGRVLYTAENAADVRIALEGAVKEFANLAGANLTGANLTGANLTGANLAGAYLPGAYLTGANLTGANLTRANLTGANLTRADLADAYLADANLAGADLTRANLTGANLTCADLTGAYLTGANLTRANGLVPERCNDLLILLEQPGKVRAYKLVNERGEGPQYGGVKYEIGQTVEVPHASTDATVQCAAGINVATLPWCLKNWRPGFRVLVVEFTKKDIAAIPLGDGKFRLFRCKVVAEKKIDPVALGLVREEKAAA